MLGWVERKNLDSPRDSRDLDIELLPADRRSEHPVVLIAALPIRQRALRVVRDGKARE